MALLQGTKALETWCRIVTEGYDNVSIVNMTTCWRSGLGFCAIIHKFRPELINFDALDPDDAFGNNDLAFTIAEQHLGIPALLDPKDMVECEILDRLSILTYLSQFYQTFHGATGPSSFNRDANNTPNKLRYIAASSGSNCSSGASTPSRSLRSSSRSKSEPCKVCNSPVFILERLNVSGRLLHRTCFRCARCGHQLSIANYYETESGTYCCEMCPDEEISQSEAAEANKKALVAFEETGIESVEAIVEKTSVEDEECSLPESMQEVKLDDATAEMVVHEPEQVKDVSETVLAPEEEHEVEGEKEQEAPRPQPECDQDHVESDEEEIIVVVPLPECDQQGNDNLEETDETENSATAAIPKQSTNPFGSDTEEDEKEDSIVPPPKPPRLSLNPFGSDFEDEDEDDDVKVPLRKKRPAPPPPPKPPRPPPPQLNLSPDKSNLEGKWKKKKGPAPPRPIPPKRQVKKLPRKAVNSELKDIEVKQQELERQGVELEKTIRQVCEKSDRERADAGLDNNDRDSLGPEAEDLIVQLFELVNEKNELFRRQTELMYMKREHRLEEEHADIEHQIRVLMAKPDALRTDGDKILEDKLIERLMAIVSQRNEIVDCLEMDRLRELEEDESIEIHMEEYAAIKPQDEDDLAKKKKEKKKKEKKKKKADKAYDADKDIDTSEFPNAIQSSSPSPKKSTSVGLDKEKTKKLKKKLMSSLKPISLKR